MKTNVKTLTLSAMFLAVALVLPFITGQIPEIGAMLCPMHIPILLCGFICGWPWGLAVGFVLPLTRSVLFGMPPMIPTALCMAFELAAYGLVSGVLHRRLKPTRGNIYLALLAAMVTGRVVWGLVMFLCMGLTGGSFTFAAFVAGAVTGAIPGIILQLVLIPLLVMLLHRKGITE